MVGPFLTAPTGSGQGNGLRSSRSGSSDRSPRSARLPRGNHGKMTFVTSRRDVVVVDDDHRDIDPETRPVARHVHQVDSRELFATAATPVDRTRRFASLPTGAGSWRPSWSRTRSTPHGTGRAAHQHGGEGCVVTPPYRTRGRRELRGATSARTPVSGRSGGVSRRRSFAGVAYWRSRSPM